MLIREYQNFDELFLKLNQEIILNPEECMDYTQNIQGFMEDLIITCHGHGCTLDLGDFGYKVGKWGHLLRSYIDYPQLLEFREKLQTISGMSYTYYFNRKKATNGSCLIAVVMTRPKRKGPWKHMKIMYRVCELQKKFAADLVLINRFIEELPQECCEIDEITFHMSQAYLSGMFINGYFEYFKVDRKIIEKSKHPWHRTLTSNFNRFFKSPDQIHSYKALQKMQKLHFGMEDFESIQLEKLSIDEYFK
jgi:hypothetical protein